MKKIFLALILLGVIIVGFRPSKPTYTVTITTLSIKDITEKIEHEGSYYLTIVLDDFVVEDYSLAFNQLTLPTEENLYNQLTVNTGYVGVCLEVPYFQERGEFLLKLKSQDTANWKIISVTTSENQVVT